MNSRVITFLGSDHKVGSSCVGKAVAETLAKENPEKKVLFIDADREFLSVPQIRIPECANGRESLRDIASIARMARRQDNLYALESCESDFSAFRPDMAGYFISVLKDNVGMDYIICATNDIEHSLPLGCLMASDSVYIVLTHGTCCEESIRRFEWMSCLYERLELPVRGFVINHYDKKSAYSPLYIKERLNISEECISCIAEAANKVASHEGFSIAGSDGTFDRDVRSFIEHEIFEK